MTWQVHIVGAHLAHHATLLAASCDGYRIVKGEGETLLLTAAEFQECHDADHVQEAAATLLASLSGLLWYRFGEKVSLLPGAVQRPNDTGPGLEIVVTFCETVGFTEALAFPEGQVAVSGQPHQESLGSSISTNPRLAKVFRLLASDERDWSGLYRLYEEIEAEMGGDKRAIAAAGWATASEIERFKRTANTPAAAGDKARHGEQGLAPPKRPMMLPEAQTLIEGIARAWVHSLAGGAQ